MTLLIQRSILQIHCVPVQFHFLLLSERQSIASNAQLYSLEALITINRTDLFNVLYYRHVHGLTCLHVYTSMNATLTASLTYLQVFNTLLSEEHCISDDFCTGTLCRSTTAMATVAHSIL